MEYRFIICVIQFIENENSIVITNLDNNQTRVRFETNFLFWICSAFKTIDCVLENIKSDFLSIQQCVYALLNDVIDIPYQDQHYTCRLV